MTIFLDQNQKPVRKPKGEKISWRISGYALVLRNRAVLMVKPHWNTLWELPGGGIEINESISAGITRECLEETSLSIRVTSDLPLFIGEQDFYSNLHKKFFHSVFTIYPAKIYRHQQIKKVENNNEISEVSWVSLRQLNKKNCHPIIWPAIQKVK